jgi:competence protein ComEA
MITSKEHFILLGLAGLICVSALAAYAYRHSTPDVQGRAEIEERLAKNVPAERVPAILELPPERAAEPVKDIGAIQATPAPVEPVAAEPEIGVAIAGAVQRSGVYTLPASSRVQDLVDTAGGVTDEADLSDINLAALLIDGTTLTIASRRDMQREGVTLISRRGHESSALNPPEYTISGWRPPAPAQPKTPDAPVSPSATPVTNVTSAPTGLIDLNRASAAELETLPGIGPVMAKAIVDYRTKTPFRKVEDLTEVSGIGPKRLEAIRALVTVGP